MEPMINPTVKDYNSIWNNFHLKCNAPEMIPIYDEQVRMVFYSFINYLPAIIGMTVARLLNLSAVLMIYLARLVTLIFYIWACCHAIRKTPIGKGLFTFFALLPMCMMYSGAISYDTIIIVAVLNFIASVLKLNQNRESVSSLIEASVWSFVLGAVKGGGYLIILPFALILTLNKGWRRNLTQLVCIFGTGLFSLVLFDIILPTEQLFQFGSAGNGNYTSGFALQNPFQYLQMVIETYILQPDELSIDGLGRELAQGEPVIPIVLIASMLLLTCIYSIFENDSDRLRNPSKYIMIIILIISAVGIPVMLLSWTQMYSSSIGGLQGRYYLPMLPFIVMLLTKFSFHHPLTQGKEIIFRKIVSSFSLLSFISVFFMLKLYLTR